MLLPFISRQNHTREIAHYAAQLVEAQRNLRSQIKRNDEIIERMFSHLAGKYTDQHNLGLAFTQWQDETQAIFLNAVAEGMAGWDGSCRDWQLNGISGHLSEDAKQLVRDLAEFVKEK